MYQSRSFLKTPRDEEKLWRYMDLSEFIYLLSESRLYFSELRQFPDKCEGAFPNAINEPMKEHPGVLWAKQHTNENQALEMVRTDFKQKQHCYGVNCWHLNDVESVAMWKLYTSGIDGVAIQTTVGRLKASLALEPRDLFIAKVRYIDHEAEQVSEPMEADALTPLIIKRRSYRHEREVRIILDRPPANDPYVEYGMRLGIGHLGETLQVDITKLIEKIVVAEKFPPWAISSLQEFLDAKDIQVKIEGSDLLNTPQAAVDLSSRSIAGSVVAQTPTHLGYERPGKRITRKHE
jgi:hypothetical protein